DPRSAGGGAGEARRAAAGPHPHQQGGAVCRPRRVDRQLSRAAAHGHHGLDLHGLAAPAGVGRRGVTNVTWEVVQRDYDRLRLQVPRFCGCDTCRGDVLVFTLNRLAPHYAGVGVMGVAGLLGGAAALRERAATCEGRWTAGESRLTAGEGRWKAGEAGTRAATVRLGDPAPHSGGPVEAYVVPGPCGGALRLRWPDG